MQQDSRMEPKTKGTPAHNDDILSEDELMLLEQCRKDWKEHPETFISIANYKKKRGIA